MDEHSGREKYRMMLKESEVTVGRQQRRASFSCQLEGLTFDSRILIQEFMVHLVTARCSCPVAAKQVQILTPPLLCLTVMLLGVNAD